MSINLPKELLKRLRAERGRNVPRAAKVSHSPVRLPDGNVQIDVQDTRTGKLVEQQCVKNRVVTTGLWALRDLLVDYGLAPKFFAVGDNNTLTSDDMEALQSEVYRTTISRRDRIGAKAVYQAYLTEAMANGETLQEAGLFVNTGWAAGTVAEGGALFARTVFTPITKTADVFVTFTWEVSIARA